MEKTKKKLWIARIIIVALMSIITLSKIVPTIQHSMYHGGCTATITDIWEREAYIHMFPIHLYQIEYAYTVDGQEYEGTTGWLDQQSLSLLSDGDQFQIKFDEAKPWLSAAPWEPDDTTSTMLLLGILSLIWAWLELG